MKKAYNIAIVKCYKIFPLCDLRKKKILNISGYTSTYLRVIVVACSGAYYSMEKRITEKMLFSKQQRGRDIRHQPMNGVEPYTALGQLPYLTKMLYNNP